MTEQSELLERAMVALADAQAALTSAHAAAPDDRELAGLRDVVSGAVGLVILRRERDGDRTPAKPKARERTATEAQTATPCPNCGAPLYVIEWKANTRTPEHVRAFRFTGAGIERTAHPWGSWRTGAGTGQGARHQRTR